MKITWNGHSNFRLEAGDAVLYFDPFFVGNPSAPSTYQDVDRCDLILVTHDHADHLGQALELAVKHDAEVVAIFDLIQSLLAQGLPESLGVGMNVGGTVVRKDIAVSMVQAMHSSAAGSPVGFILTFPDNYCVYFAGDTGLFASMELFGEFHDIDLAMLPMDGRFNMDAAQAAHACKLLGCKKVIPMHWGTWPILAQSTEPFARELAKRAPGVELLSMKPGQTLEL